MYGGDVTQMRKRLRSVLVIASIVLVCVIFAGGVFAQQQDGQAHFQLHGKVIPLGEDGIHDPENDATEILQAPYEALKDFPRDNYGLIDWIGAIDNGLISPRADVTGKEQMHAVDLDLVLKNTSSMPFVNFPHSPHTKWLTCQNCHPAIFLPQRGGNFMTMADIMQGKYCGVCHGKIAFPPLECARCHSVPKASGGIR